MEQVVINGVQTSISHSSYQKMYAAWRASRATTAHGANIALVLITTIAAIALVITLAAAAWNLMHRDKYPSWDGVIVSFWIIATVGALGLLIAWSVQSKALGDLQTSPRTTFNQWLADRDN